VDDAEITLAGGNSNSVVRVGDTVRRRVPGNGASVHALLTHLAERGFPYSPRFLGIDDRGREVLGFIAGDAGLHPFSAAVRSADALVACVRMVREYHDATAPFARTALAWPGRRVCDLPVEVVCHGDLAPYNIVYRGATPVGMIDFDNAAAGSRVEDLAGLVYRLAPLSAPVNYAGSGWTDDVDTFARLRTVVRTYGDADWSRLVELVLLELDAMCSWITERADRGDPAVAVHVAEDHVGSYRADIRWIEQHRSRLEATIAGA
jgi:hypothetical protein